MNAALAALDRLEAALHACEGGCQDAVITAANELREELRAALGMTADPLRDAADMLRRAEQHHWDAWRRHGTYSEHAAMRHEIMQAQRAIDRALAIRG